MIKYHEYNKGYEVGEKIKILGTSIEVEILDIKINSDDDDAWVCVKCDYDKIRFLDIELPSFERQRTFPRPGVLWLPTSKVWPISKKSYYYPSKYHKYNIEYVDMGKYYKVIFSLLEPHLCDGIRAYYDITEKYTYEIIHDKDDLDIYKKMLDVLNSHENNACLKSICKYETPVVFTPEYDIPYGLLDRDFKFPNTQEVVHILGFANDNGDSNVEKGELFIIPKHASGVKYLEAKFREEKIKSYTPETVPKNSRFASFGLYKHGHWVEYSNKDNKELRGVWVKLTDLWPLCRISDDKYFNKLNLIRYFPSGRIDENDVIIQTYESGNGVFMKYRSGYIDRLTQHEYTIVKRFINAVCFTIYKNYWSTSAI